MSACKNVIQKQNWRLTQSIVTYWVICSVEIAAQLVADTDMSSDTISFSSPVMSSENIRKTICALCPLRLHTNLFHALYYRQSHIPSRVFTYFLFLSCVYFLFYFKRNKISQKSQVKLEFCLIPVGTLEQRKSLIHQNDFSLCCVSGFGPL